MEKINGLFPLLEVCKKYSIDIVELREFIGNEISKVPYGNGFITVMTEKTLDRVIQHFV